MTKKEIIKFLEPFTDEIETNIKAIHYGCSVGCDVATLTVEVTDETNEQT